jgi:hypothetical protein
MGNQLAAFLVDKSDFLMAKIMPYGRENQVGLNEVIH